MSRLVRFRCRKPSLQASSSRSLKMLTCPPSAAFANNVCCKRPRVFHLHVLCFHRRALPKKRGAINPNVYSRDFVLDLAVSGLSPLVLNWKTSPFVEPLHNETVNPGPASRALHHLFWHSYSSFAPSRQRLSPAVFTARLVPAPDSSMSA